MPRRYSEDDARRIFARVAERQARQTPDATGLLLSDLEEAARAAGLDPALVASAAAELDAGPAAAPRMFGAPVEVLATRVVPGTLSDGVWAQMVDAARRDFGRAGMAGQVGPRREWTLISGGSKNGITTQLTAEPVADGFRVTLSQSIRDTAFGLSLAGAITGAMALVFTLLALAGVDPELWIAAGILAAQALVFTGGTQVGTRLWQRHRTERFDALLDRMELTAREHDASVDSRPEPQATTSGRRVPLGHLLDDDPQPDAAHDETSSASRRRTRG